jgi:predicted ATP-binding protein involved in virulence
MFIQKIHLENFRLFTDLTVDFDDRLNVFLGINGAGKSALLDAIAVMLSAFVARLGDWKESDVNMYHIKETDIQLDKHFLSIHVAAKRGQTVLNWQLDLNKTNNRKNIVELKKITTNLITELENNQNMSVPILVYYNAKRLAESKRKTAFKTAFSQLLAYKNALNPAVDNFNDFENWFIDEEGFEDKMRLEGERSYRNPKLQVIRKVIHTFLNQLGDVRFDNLKVRKKRNDKSLINSVLVISKNEKALELAQLSMGEKMILSTIIDITHRLTLANPSLENPLEGQGVVLIDEIDLHLHPQWQQGVVPALLATFPNVQFIITTHSPLVLNQIDKKHILTIGNGQILKNQLNTNGKDVNSILNQVFKTDERPSNIKRKLLKCAELFDNGDYEKGKKLLDQLTVLLGEDDPQIIETNTFLHFYADEIA